MAKVEDDGDNEDAPLLPTQRVASASEHLLNDRMLRLVTNRVIIIAMLVMLNSLLV